MTLSDSYERQKSTFFQRYFWHVFPGENKKALYLGFIGFLIWGINCLLYPFLQSFLIMAPNSGAEVIGFLRIFGTLPLGILFIILYTWLLDKYPKLTVTYIFFGGTTCFYSVFAFFLIPLKSEFKIDPEIISEFMQNYPHLKWLFPIFGNWVESLFFICSEVILSVSLSQFFWQTANHFTDTSQASRLYPIYIIFMGLGGVFASFILDLFIDFGSSYDHILGIKKSVLSLQISTIFIIILIMHLMLIFKKLYNEVLPPEENKVFIEVKPQQKKRFTLTGFWYLFHSKYLLYIFLTLVSFQMINQLISYTWKSELKLYVSKHQQYNDFMNHYSFWENFILILGAVAFKNFIHKRGWLTASFMTPLIGLITATPFFLLLYWSKINGNSLQILNYNLHYFMAIFGSFQTIFMVTVYTCLYYPTKEMAYIPLDPDVKSKGKAATDILGSSCGRAGGGIVQEGLLSWSGGADLSIIPQVLALVLGFFATWFYAVRALGKNYAALIKKNHE
ncbi:MAG: NTP/NDP exchange transporter [Alphaproteobacteria bacterium]|nr:NTP/NDP exchange transporter [Alphaproteobacteria bacterium]